MSKVEAFPTPPGFHECCVEMYRLVGYPPLFMRVVLPRTGLSDTPPSFHGSSGENRGDVEKITYVVGIFCAVLGCWWDASASLVSAEKNTHVESSVTTPSPQFS